MNFSQPEMWVLGILLAVLAWVGNKMVAKVDNLTNTITNMDKNLAVMLSELKRHEEKVSFLEKRILDLDSKYAEMQSYLHQITRVEH